MSLADFDRESGGCGSPYPRLDDNDNCAGKCGAKKVTVRSSAFMKCRPGDMRGSSLFGNFRNAKPKPP